MIRDTRTPVSKQFRTVEMNFPGREKTMAFYSLCSAPPMADSLVTVIGGAAWPPQTHPLPEIYLGDPPFL